MFSVGAGGVRYAITLGKLYEAGTPNCGYQSDALCTFSVLTVCLFRVRISINSWDMSLAT